MMRSERTCRALALAALAFCPGFTTAAPIAIDSVATYSTGFVRQPGGIHTITNAALGGFDISGSDKLVVAFSGENHGSGVTSVTYGGVPLQEGLTVPNAQRVTHIWYLDNPSANGDLVFDFVQSNANGVGGSIFGLSNTLPDFGATGSSLNSTSVSVTTTASSSLVVAFAVNNSDGTPPSPDAPLDLLASVSSGSSGHGSGALEVPTAGTEIVANFWGASPIYGVGAMEFLADSAAAGVQLAIVPDAGSPGQYDFSWNSQAGKLYDLVSATDLTTSPDTWLAYDPDGAGGTDPYEDIPSAGALTSLSAVVSADATRFFAVVEKDPPVSPITSVRVFLVGGQSNADGRAASSSLPTSPVNLQLPQDDIDFYYQVEGGSATLTTLQPGLSETGGFGPAITFGRKMADTLVTDAVTRVAIIKYANGGTNLESQWAAGGDGTTSGDGPEYVTFQQTVSGGLAALGAAYPLATVEVEGMIWVQGESDIVGGFAGNYQANLTAFIADISATYGANLPFIVTRLSSAQTALNATGLATVRAAQVAVADGDSFADWIDTDSFGMKGDNLHFDAAGQQQMGDAAATALLGLLP